MDKYREELKELLEEEYGEIETLDQKVIDTGIDSFGITMVFLELNKRYGIYKDFSAIDFSSLTIKDVLKEMKDASENS